MASLSRPISWHMQKIFLCCMSMVCSFALICSLGTLKQAWAAEPYKIDDTSYSVAQYLQWAKAQNTSEVWASVNNGDLGSAVVDWGLASLKGYKKSFFETGPYKAQLGGYKANKSLRFASSSPITVENIYFKTQGQIIVDTDAQVNFKDVTFTVAPIIKGSASFENCVFEDATVIFEGGSAQYIGTTQVPTEQGNKKQEQTHFPLSLVLEQESLSFVQGKEVDRSIGLSIEGTYKDQAQLKILPEDALEGLSVSYKDGRLSFKGKPSKEQKLELSLEVSYDSGDTREQAQAKLQIQVHPKLMLKLPNNLFVTTKYAKQYQQNLKPQIIVGDREPQDLLEFMQQDEDGKKLDVSKDLKIITEQGLPQGYRASWIYDSVVIAGDNAQPKGSYPIKLQIKVKDQLVESNAVILRVFDGDETLKQQIEDFYIKEAKSPARWEMKPYIILRSDGAVIPNSMRVLMGSDCTNPDAEEKTHGEYAKEALAEEERIKNLSEEDAALVALFNKLYPNGMVDAITMASGVGGGVNVGGDGAAGSGSCYIGVVGVGEPGNYATDPIYIPSGTNVSFKNMKFLSSVKIVVQDGGKLTLDDAVAYGDIVVEKGGVLSAKNGSSMVGSVIFEDGAIMENLKLKSHANHLSDDNTKRPVPEAVVIVKGHLEARGINSIAGDGGNRNHKGQTKSQDALHLKEGARITITKGSVLNAHGGDSEPYNRKGGDGVVAEKGSSITGEGAFIVSGGSSYEDVGGVGVLGPSEGEFNIDVAKAVLIGGSGKSIIGLPAPGAHATSGNLLIDPKTELEARGGEGMLENRQKGTRAEAFDPRYPAPVKSADEDKQPEHPALDPDKDGQADNSKDVDKGSDFSSGSSSSSSSGSSAVVNRLAALDSQDVVRSESNEQNKSQGSQSRVKRIAQRSNKNTSASKAEKLENLSAEKTANTSQLEKTDPKDEKQVKQELADKSGKSNKEQSDQQSQNNQLKDSNQGSLLGFGLYVLIVLALICALGAAIYFLWKKNRED